jgi:hypothetical protein
MNECRVAQCRAEHKRAIAELQKGLWSSDGALNMRYLEWKYARNPYVRETLIYVALDGDRVVGMRGFHGARLEAGIPARTFPALFADDALIASECRNRGLVTRILSMAHADLAERGHRLLVSIGNASRVNGLGLMTRGWRSAGGLRPLGRVSEHARRRTRLRRAVARLPVIWRYAYARFLASADQRRPFRHLDASMTRRRLSGPSITVERTPRLDAMAGLVERLPHDGRIRHARDREYLGWRFANPLSEFRFLYFGDARIDGYLVLARRASDLGAFDRVYVSDLEGTDEAVRAGLLHAAIDRGRFPLLVTWSASLRDESLQTLSELGFIPIDTDESARGFPCVLARLLPDDQPVDDWTLGGRRLLNVADWDVRVLYSMRA